ncbi:MAG: hypothetical protein HC828_14425 [Blastochloris sp.]|nr:hypothetical protein [Blastochloris sp.]
MQAHPFRHPVEIDREHGDSLAIDGRAFLVRQVIEQQFDAPPRPGPASCATSRICKSVPSGTAILSTGNWNVTVGTSGRHGGRARRVGEVAARQDHHRQRDDDPHSETHIAVRPETCSSSH